MKRRRHEDLPVPTDGYDNDDGDHSLIKGEIAKCVDGIWSVKDSASLPAEDTATRLVDGAQRCSIGKASLPVESNRQSCRGKPFPDANELNASHPEKKNGKKASTTSHVRRGSRWKLSTCSTRRRRRCSPTLTSTVGTSIAVRHFRDKVKMMRMLRGNKVVPIVELGLQADADKARAKN